MELRARAPWALPRAVLGAVGGRCSLSAVAGRCRHFVAPPTQLCRKNKGHPTTLGDCGLRALHQNLPGPVSDWSWAGSGGLTSLEGFALLVPSSGSLWVPAVRDKSGSALNPPFNLSEMLCTTSSIFSEARLAAPKRM